MKKRFITKLVEVEGKDVDILITPEYQLTLVVDGKDVITTDVGKTYHFKKATLFKNNKTLGGMLEE